MRNTITNMGPGPAFASAPTTPAALHHSEPTRPLQPRTRIKAWPPAPSWPDVRWILIF
jgi:hypothetical protein